MQDTSSFEKKIKNWASLSMWFGIFGYFIIFMPFTIYFGYKAHKHAKKNNLNTPVTARIGFYLTILWLLFYFSLSIISL